MKMLLTAEFPHELFNSLHRSGKVGGIIERILESINPESAALYGTRRKARRIFHD